MINIFGILGFQLALGIIVLACLLGSKILAFVNIPSIAVVIGLALGLQLSTVGVQTFLKTLKVMQVIFFNPPLVTVAAVDAVNLRHMATHLYVGGFIGILIGWIQILANVNDPSRLGPVISVSLLTVFYALVLAECVVRPCALRIENLLAREEVGGGVIAYGTQQRT